MEKRFFVASRRYGNPLHECCNDGFSRPIPHWNFDLSDFVYFFFYFIFQRLSLETILFHRFIFFFPPFRFVRYRREFISLRSNECWTEMGEEMGGKLSIFWLEDDRDGRSILKKTKSLVLYRKLYRDSKIVGIKTGVV